ncbi:endonuclease domain-containing 1 protein-like [Channa argus]|uniref:endonuclease domain-containing 1 protein-like n=1 Tax=Channa argus TaxID=215402 RepID=UPI0035209C7E
MMTPLKTWCLLYLSVLLLLLSIAPTLSEVVQSMTQCEGFFLRESPPNIPDILEKGKFYKQQRYKRICQTYNDEKRFVTLYDTKNKIPVFSAFKFRGAGVDTKKLCFSRPPWKIEPQLEHLRRGRNMQDCNSVKYNHQASDQDYKDQVRYSRGHLFPCSYAFNESDKKSTFTLTNTVPQVQSFNEGSWGKMETCVKCVLEGYCLQNEGYVVTGALPGRDKLNNRVNVPSILWSAFCCYSDKKNKWLASAFWELNGQSKREYMHTNTLEQLQKKWEKITRKTGFEVFPGTNCPLKETVAELYHEINNKKKKKKCQCPSKAATTSFHFPHAWLKKTG